jgi:hypothetical protein
LGRGKFGNNTPFVFRHVFNQAVGNLCQRRLCLLAFFNLLIQSASGYSILLLNRLTHFLEMICVMV